MNRIRATILLLVYTAFSFLSVSSFAVPPGEHATEGTEKEVFNSSVNEHREGTTIRLSGQNQHCPHSTNGRVEGTAEAGPYNSGKISIGSTDCKVPIYIMHCVYLL